MLVRLTQRLTLFARCKKKLEEKAAEEEEEEEEEEAEEEEEEEVQDQEEDEEEDEKEDEEEDEDGEGGGGSSGTVDPRRPTVRSHKFLMPTSFLVIAPDYLSSLSLAGSVQETYNYLKKVRTNGHERRNASVER
jgi:ABC-type Zn2+ transport system substrate-binding protein/surface adhesin